MTGVFLSVFCLSVLDVLCLGMCVGFVFAPIGLGLSGVRWVVFPGFWPLSPLDWPSCLSQTQTIDQHRVVSVGLARLFRLALPSYFIRNSSRDFAFKSSLS